MALKRHYYAADNRYGTPRDYGFSNTWYAIRFESSKERGAFVADSPRRSTRRITAKQIKEYGGIQELRVDGERWDYDERTGAIAWIGAVTL